MNQSLLRYGLLSATVIMIFLLLSVSLFSYFRADTGTRYVFLFASPDWDKPVAETRFLHSGAGNLSDEVSYYVKDLLLGSMTNRCLPVFAPGTELLSCFIRDNSLYLDLSGDLMYAEKQLLSIKDGMNLLKENIFRNFDSITDIVIFVDGNAVYDYPDGSGLI